MLTRIERSLHHRAAQSFDLFRSFVGAGNGDVRRPVRGHLLHVFTLLIRGRDRLSVERVDCVNHARADGIIRSLPSKQIRVKLFRARPVSGHQFNPTETSRRVFQLSLSRSVAHLFVLLLRLEASHSSPVFSVRRTMGPPLTYSNDNEG